MPEHAWEIIPTLYTDENGVEHLNYDYPQISNSAVKEAGLEYHRENEASYITTDSLGRGHHEADHLEIDQYGGIANHSTGEYIETPESEQYLNYPDIERRDIEGERWDEFSDEFLASVGGDDAYNNLLDWGSQYADEDFIDSFNEALESQDIDSFLELYELLVEAYNEQH